MSSIADAGGSDAGNLQSYTYQGLDTIVGGADGNGVTETTTLDNFGRTAQMDYVNSSGTSTDDFAYGYDRDGNVLYKNNLLDSSESELYHGNSTTTGDNNAAYDPLNRLTGFERGTLSSSGDNGTTLDTVASPSAAQSWNLNAVGDQSSVTTNGTTTTNATNAKNELTGNGANSLTYDNNGNTLTDENGQTYTYDAWNRVVTAKNSSGTTIAAYSYDPTGRRITETSGGTTTDIYFTSHWQDIEERQGGTVTRQNVWGLGYVNQLVERDDNSVSGNLGITGSGLGERLYAQQDANWNVTCLVNSSGNVVERIVYSPYGTVSFMTASWAPTTDAYAQNVLFQGGRLETTTGNYVFEHRDYEPVTGTWKEADPDVYVNGPDMYQIDGSEPMCAFDPSGLDFSYGPSENGGMATLGSRGAFDPNLAMDVFPDFLAHYIFGNGAPGTISDNLVSQIKNHAQYKSELAKITQQLINAMPTAPGIKTHYFYQHSVAFGNFEHESFYLGTGTLELNFRVNAELETTCERNGHFVGRATNIKLVVTENHEYTFDNGQNFLFQWIFHGIFRGTPFRIIKVWNDTIPPFEVNLGGAGSGAEGSW